MTKDTFKSKIKLNIILTLSFYLIIGLSVYFFYKEYSVKLVHANFTSFEYYNIYISGMSFIYLIVPVLFIPYLLNNFNINLSISNVDKFIIQRKTYDVFYKENIIRSFYKGVIFGLIINFFILIAFIILCGFNIDKLFLPLYEQNFLFFNEINSLQLLIYSFFTQSLGLGITNVFLFTLTRYRPNKYLYYLSLIFWVALTTTGMSALLSLLGTSFPIIYNFSTPILYVLSVLNPISIILPLQTIYTGQLATDIRFILSFIITFISICFFIKYTLKKEKSYG